MPPVNIALAIDAEVFRHDDKAYSQHQGNER
jgi:hypothetical protein